MLNCGTMVKLTSGAESYVGRPINKITPFKRNHELSFVWDKKMGNKSYVVKGFTVCLHICMYKSDANVKCDGNRS